MACVATVSYKRSSGVNENNPVVVWELATRFKLISWGGVFVELIFAKLLVKISRKMLVPRSI